MSYLPKKIRLVLLGLLISVTSMGNGIEFTKGSWSEILSKAKVEEKYIFVDFYAEWCGPCKWIAAKVFTDGEVGSYFNQQFINISIDAEYELSELVNASDITAYPTLAVFDPSGNEVLRIVGAIDKGELLAFGKNAVSKDDIIAAYQSNKEDPEVVKAYAQLLAFEDQERAGQVVKGYLEALPQSSLQREANWLLISEFLEDYKSETFGYIDTNWEDFHQSYGEDFEDYALKKVLTKMIQDACLKKDVQLLDKSVAFEYDFRQRFGSDLTREYIRLETYYAYYYNIEEYNAYFDTFSQFLQGYHWEDLDYLVSETIGMCRRIYELDLDPARYDTVEAWADQAIKLDNEHWKGYISKAYIYYFQDDYDLSKKYAQKALARAEDAVKPDIEGFIASLD